MNKIKFKVIVYLNKNPEYCWANLVQWAEGIKPFWSLFFKNHPDNDYKDQVCRKNNEGTPYAYCNKCEITKRYYDNF